MKDWIWNIFQFQCIVQINTWCFWHCSSNWCYTTVNMLRFINKRILFSSWYWLRAKCFRVPSIHISADSFEYYETGLCRGCILGTFSTLKSGMSSIILAVGANVPTYLRFMNGNIAEVTPEKLTMSPYFPMVWVTCPHVSKALAEYWWNSHV